jgi:arylsulfatase A-like enzyme
VQITDVLPTLCALTGVAQPHKELDGRVLIEDGRASSDTRHDEPLYYISMNGEAQGIEGMTEKLAVLWSPWKLIYTPAIGDIELYRLDLDPGELENVAESEPAIRERLMNSLESWLTEAVETGAQDTGVSPEQAWFLQQLGYTK